MCHRLSAVFVALITLAATPWSVQAQAPYPSQPIRLIVQAAAGGLPDTVARIVGQRLQERVGQSVVVENRPGANGSIAANALAQAPADGHTFMVSDGSIISINPVIYNKLPYNPKDLMPVSLVARAPLFLAVHPKVPVATMKEFIDYAQKNPGQINYGSSGVGSTHHLSMEAMKAALKLQMTHVPYKGTGESVPALIGGHVEALFSAYPSIKGHAESNRVKVLATNGSSRSPQAPDVPPIAEFIPDFDFAVLVGFFAKAGTPPAVIEKIAQEVAAITKEPDALRRFGAAGIEAVGGGPDELGQALKNESDRVAKAVQAAGIKPE